MIPALSPVTIGGAPSNLREYIALAERYGFGGVEIDLRAVRTAVEQSSLGAVRTLFEQLDCAPASAGLPVEWRKDDATFEAGVAELRELADLSQQIGCSRICTWLPPTVDEDASLFRDNTARRMRVLADLLAARDLRLGLEFVGPKTLRSGSNAMGANEFIYNLPQTLELISEIAAPAGNVGLLVDSFHWFCTGSNPEELAGLTPEQIVQVHINDAPDKPLDEQIDQERLLPGLGVINLRLFLRTLASAGYRGFVAVETFSAKLKAIGHEVAAERAGDAMERLFMRDGR